MWRNSCPDEWFGTVLFDAGCTSFAPADNGFAVTSAPSIDGVAGFVPEVTIVQTSGVCSWNSLDNTCDGRLVGSFDLSTGFSGAWKPVAGTTASVIPGSAKVSTSTDMRGKVNRGDKIKIGAESDMEEELYITE